MGQETSKCRRPPGDQWQRARPVNKLVLLQQQELPQHHVGLVEAILVDVVPQGIGKVLVVILTAAPGVVVVAGESSFSLAVAQVNSSGRTIVKTFTSG